MAKLDFPSSPVPGTKYPASPAADQPVYTWDGEKWATAVIPSNPQRISLAGGRLFDIQCPADASAVRLTGAIQSTIANNFVLMLRVSVAPDVFLAGATDYSTTGFSHYSTAPTAVNALVGEQALGGMRISGGHISTQFPLTFDGLLVLKRYDVSVGRFLGDFRASNTNVSGIGHVFYQSYVTTAAGSAASIIAIRILSSVTDNWGAESFLTVEWL